MNDSAAYVPFPTFAEWSNQANGHGAFERLAAEFRCFGAEQRARYSRESTRFAAVDTNAIEGVFRSDRGFTYSVAKQAHGWESAMEERGVHVRPSFEAAMDGYNLALDVATGRWPLTEALIRRLHETIMASQKQPLQRGVYKSQQNSPVRPDGSQHVYASPEETPSEMQRLVEQCRLDEFVAAHPVVQASYVHYAFVCVHPFADGNGRVARALASVFLYRDPGIPLVIFDDQKHHYYDALESADAGVFRPFIDFIEQRAIDTMNVAMLELGGTDDVDSALADLGDASALRLADMVFTELERQFGALQHHPLFDATIARTCTTPTCTDADGFSFSLTPTSSSGSQVTANFSVFANPQATDRPEYIVACTYAQPFGRPVPRNLEVFRRELTPGISLSLTTRIRAWSAAVLADAVRAFKG
ncbi:hypothetical protein HMPREF3170_06755 [Corynebacterium sp. HMSC08D02]|uniref:Fic family protein n=1 Tax=Corynebacterium sp. HMSC08D02 TaxID=1581138 RepID=UPI0008A1DD4E|nr:Fic family protein [Corynebacterium sp. HMSC08D02]OFT29286.1 hypothetical protein HMPREF3170_06755 [Corynebacterium sp. HMSC08D02]